MQKVEDQVSRASQAGTIGQSELVGYLRSGVSGLSQEQATAGAGMIFRFLKHKLDDQDFTTLDTLVPESDELVTAAPPEEPAQPIFSGINQALGGRQLALLGNLGTMAASLAKLGIAPDQLTAMVERLLDYVREQGGDSLREVVARALKS